MPRPANLLTLPYELRRAIFCHYFTVEGGYVFNAKSKKLTTVDGGFIELSLIYTCRSIAADTNDLPLKLNSITFSTMFCEDLRPWAARFQYLSVFQYLVQSDLLLHLRRYITPEMHSQIALKFPRFLSHLDKVLKRFQEAYGQKTHISPLIGGPSLEFWRRLTKLHMPSRGLMSASSEFISTAEWPNPSLMIKQAITYTLQLVKQQNEGRFAKLSNRAFPRWRGSQSPCRLEDIWLEPWAMPESSLLRSIGQLFKDSAAWKEIDDWHPWPANLDTDSEASDSDEPEELDDLDELDEGDEGDEGDESDGPDGPEATWLFREKFRFSAAAVAIWFFKRLPNQKRQHLRNVLLNEDHVSVHNPECHVHGLIPFCKENPNLHIERRVSLFHNAFHDVPGLSDLIDMVEKNHDEDIPLTARSITRCLSGWLLEALDAVDAGMPSTSFTLVLDGEPDVNTCSDIFQQVVHQDVAWEMAYRERLVQGDSPPFFFKDGFVKEGFPEAMEHLINQTSVIRCNFHPGQFWDTDRIHKLSEELSSVPLFLWQTRRFRTQPRDIQLPPPLPEWRELLLESFDWKPQEGSTRA
ncbi:hypothetical protein BHE90_002914 [Fusarium euwallaceae]|uniref:Uncharacterized protein n=1 Tax=Fusarium euwallaceae TaxID=1147111 RepID=A0A430M3L2_9HYPO|nr:hypothetical protein BHE90_002914 [Fusarium euwallaceae]